MEQSKKKGRPRKHADQKQRVAAWRKKQEGRRLDGYVSSSASWRLKRLSEVWECSLADSVERLIMEADKHYSDVLFPET